MRNTPASTPCVLLSVHNESDNVDQNALAFHNALEILTDAGVPFKVLDSVGPSYNIGKKIKGQSQPTRNVKKALLLDYLHRDLALQLASDRGQDYVADVDAFKVVSYSYLKDGRREIKGTLESIRSLGEIKSTEPFLEAEDARGIYYVIR